MREAEWRRECDAWLSEIDGEPVEPCETCLELFDDIDGCVWAYCINPLPPQKCPHCDDEYNLGDHGTCRPP